MLAERREGGVLLGTESPPLAGPGVRWIGGPALELREGQLRGKAVLVRFFTEGCALCEQAAPTLNALHERFAGDGLAVVGVYHPKPYGRKVADAEVERAAARLRFRFRIAVDEDWNLLRRWWLENGAAAGGREARSYTSASFLIDREGRIRWVHAGGEYGEDDVSDLEALVAG